MVLEASRSMRLADDVVVVAYQARRPFGEHSTRSRPSVPVCPQGHQPAAPARYDAPTKRATRASGSPVRARYFGVGRYEPTQLGSRHCSIGTRSEHLTEPESALRDAAVHCELGAHPPFRVTPFWECPVLPLSLAPKTRALLATARLLHHELSREFRLRNTAITDKTAVDVQDATKKQALSLDQLPGDVGENVLSAMRALDRARRYAISTTRDQWDFAIESRRLHEFGLTDCELRWLIGTGIAMSAEECPPSSGEARLFEHQGTMALSESTCFVLTEAGAELLAEVTHVPRLVDVPYSAEADHGQAATSKPVWNRDRRVLRVLKTVVKEFRVPAKNQERILDCFAEEDWPERILDPLSPLPSVDPKRRLQSAIMCLNRNQRRPLIRFRGDGSGSGILWELRSEAS